MPGTTIAKPHMSPIVADIVCASSKKHTIPPTQLALRDLGKCTFLSCPCEVRDQIYGEVLSKDVRYTRDLTFRRSGLSLVEVIQGIHFGHLNLFLVSQQVGEEAIRVFYKANIFRFYAPKLPRMWTPFISSKALGLMSRLEVLQTVWRDEYQFQEWYPSKDFKMRQVLNEFAQEDSDRKAAKITLELADCRQYDWRFLSAFMELMKAMRHFRRLAVDIEHGYLNPNNSNSKWYCFEVMKKGCGAHFDIACGMLKNGLETHLGEAQESGQRGRRRLIFHPRDWAEKQQVKLQGRQLETQ